MSLPISPAGAKTGTGQEATILSVAEVPAREPNRLGKTDYLVTYQVGFNVFTVTVPAENATRQIIEAAIRADYQKRAALLGGTVQL